jgi:hypothetical protein
MLQGYVSITFRVFWQSAAAQAAALSALHALVKTA